MDESNHLLLVDLAIAQAQEKHGDVTLVVDWHTLVTLMSAVRVTLLSAAVHQRGGASLEQASKMIFAIISDKAPQINVAMKAAMQAMQGEGQAIRETVHLCPRCQVGLVTGGKCNQPLCQSHWRTATQGKK